jgi:HEAT repeat protein
MVGAANVRLTLLLPQEEGRTEGLNSNVVEVKVNPRPLVKMTPEARKEYVADLMRQFDKDEWSAQKAHDQAVALGKDLVPDLIPAAKDRKRPTYARMWLTTALADIRDEQSAGALEDLLDDRDAEVVCVVGYHGAKQRSDRLDDVITRKVEKGKDNRFAAYAILGYIVFRGTAPDELMKLTLDSNDPGVRRTLSMALKNHASDFNMSRLTEFLSDTNENVRISSARMLQQFGRKTPNIFRAMVSSLDYPGEAARQRICQVLGEMAGISNPYDPKADEAARQQTLKKWRDWIAKAPKRPD